MGDEFATDTTQRQEAARAFPGFTQQRVSVGSLALDCAIGGEGPPVVLLHGYPQSLDEWRHIAPRLAERYTVIVPSLRGAGRSDAPPAGYDKKTMAQDIYELLVLLGHDKDIRLVGHDIGLMVAYAYAAAHPHDVAKLVLAEAIIPDPALYQLPALTAHGPGAWHFGFFALANGLPEQLITGNEATWVEKFMRSTAVVREAVTDEDVEVYAHSLKDPDHLRASLEWFRALPQDMRDNERYQKNRLAMPALAIGAEANLGEYVATNVKNYASNVTSAVVANCGHWICEERPDDVSALLLDFLGTD